jgi:hypothetical protein
LCQENMQVNISKIIENPHTLTSIINPGLQNNKITEMKIFAISKITGCSPFNIDLTAPDYLIVYLKSIFNMCAEHEIHGS